MDYNHEVIFNEKTITDKLYDSGDYCLRTSLWVLGRLLFIFSKRNFNFSEYNSILSIFYKMKSECGLYNATGHKKSKVYKWSNDIHGGKPSLRYMIWRYFLRFFKIDPYCGLNGDQYRAYFATSYFLRDFDALFNVELGFIIRATYMAILGTIPMFIYMGGDAINYYPWLFLASYLIGIYPSMTEVSLLRPQARMLKWLGLINFSPKWTKPIFFVLYFIPYLISLIVFSIRADMEEKDKWDHRKEDYENGTTNKITLIPTLYLLKDKCRLNERIVYSTYFGDWEELNGQIVYLEPLSFIGYSIYEGLVNKYK